MITTNKIPIGQVESEVSQTITNGVTNKAPSEDAVFDALALKTNLNTTTNITGSCTITGWSSFTVNSVRSLDVGDAYLIQIEISGTSNSTLAEVDLPYTNNGNKISLVTQGLNNGSQNTPRIRVNSAAAKVEMFNGNLGVAWNGSGTKEAVCQFFIEK